MLASLSRQSVRPDQVIIVDASEMSDETITSEFDSLNTIYLRHSPPSAARQRNAGLSAVCEDINLIGFLDDDVVLEPEAVENMLAFWQSALSDFGGAAFNWLNPPKRSLVILKKLRLTSWLGIYSNQPGNVAASGWQSVIGTVDRDTCTQWLPSGASVWRREVFSGGAFNDYFEGYSYLEDLDFSFGAARHYRLCVVADSGFAHYPAVASRESDFNFGKIEVANRLYFVRKHGLSLWRCCIGLLIRFCMTIAAGKWTRAAGNIVGFARSLDFRRAFKSIGYFRPLIQLARILGVSGLMRRIYYSLARPKEGILPMSIDGIESRFRVHTPEELRVLESMSGGEQRVMSDVLTRLPRGATVFDIGANVGLYTIFLAKSVGTRGRVIAFEPQAQNHKHLSENIALNNLNNVMAVQKALGASRSIGRLVRGDIIGNYSLVSSSSISTNAEDVEIVAGDDFAFGNELPIPYLIKIDVEGFELAVVKGLHETLCNPGCQVVCIELHPYLLPAEVTAQHVIDSLERAGFREVSRYDRARDFHLIMAKPQQQLCALAA